MTPPPKRVAIVGAGVAGACAARAFLSRGCSVDVFERADEIAAGASGNPLALVMPRLDAADSPTARGLIEAYLCARRLFSTLAPDAALSLDVRHRARNETEARRFAKLRADPPFDGALLRVAEHDGGDLIHFGAMAVVPATALSALLEGAQLHLGVGVSAVSQGDEHALVELETGETRRFDLVIVCAGWQMADIQGSNAPDITPRLGQIEWTERSGRGAVADGGYAVEALGRLVFGATFETLTPAGPHTTSAAREDNLATLARLRPDLDAAHLSELQSRAGVRATTQDRLPFAGAALEEQTAPEGAPAPSGLIRILGGLGSRGFLWAPLLAELVASEAFGEPLPIEASVRAALDPERFRKRRLRRA